jgi:hypothetical protein
MELPPQYPTKIESIWLEQLHLGDSLQLLLLLSQLAVLVLLVQDGVDYHS